MHRLRPRDRQQTLRPGLAIPAIVAALIALALPAAVSAADLTFSVNTTSGTGAGEVECNIKEPGEELEEGLFCDGTYPPNTQITVLPTAEEGSKFVVFENGTGSASAATCTGKKVSCSFTINAISSVDARFDFEEFALKIEKMGSGGGTVECEVEGTSGLCAAEYPYETPLTLLAEPDGESEFAEWKEGCEFEVENECELTIEEETTVAVAFNLQPRLVIAVTGSGKGEGTVECEAFEGSGRGSCTQRYPEGEAVILYASAGSGAEFAGWEGCEWEEETECEVTMAGETTVKAIFTAERTLTIEKTGPGAVTDSLGLISCGSVCSGTYPVGTVVTLTAAPPPGSFFSGWAGGGCKGIVKTCTVTLDGDTTVAAEFEPIAPPDPEEELIEVEAGTARAAGAAQVKAGKAALKLTCSGGPCKGTLKLRAKVKQGKKVKTLVIGTASFKLSEDATKTLKVKLSAPAKRELGKGRTIKAKLSGTGIAASTVKLKPA